MTLLVNLCRSTVRRLFSSKYLLVTNTVSYGLMMGSADCAVQQIENKLVNKEHSQHDWKRTGRMVLLGVITGPVCHGWYSVLDHYLPSTQRTVIVKKILLDQVIAAPNFTLIFFMVAGTLERKPLKSSWLEFRSKFWKVYLFDWTLWPAAQAVNFAFVPPQYRVIYVGVITLIWDCYLTYVKHEDKKKLSATVEK